MKSVLKIKHFVSLLLCYRYSDQHFITFFSIQNSIACFTIYILPPSVKLYNVTDI